MRISDLTIRITFQKQAVQMDDIGNRKSQWVDERTVYAYPSYEGLGEKVFVGMEVDHSDMAFTVRDSSYLKSVRSPCHRINFNGDIYNIVSIDRMNYRHRYVKLRCQKERS